VRSSSTPKRHSIDAALKVIYLATEAAFKKWTMPIWNGKAASNRFMIKFEEQLAPHIYSNLNCQK
jgi:putative transposase